MALPIHSFHWGLGAWFPSFCIPLDGGAPLIDQPQKFELFHFLSEGGFRLTITTEVVGTQVEDCLLCGRYLLSPPVWPRFVEGHNPGRGGVKDNPSLLDAIVFHMMALERYSFDSRDHLSGPSTARSVSPFSRLFVLRIRLMNWICQSHLWCPVRCRRPKSLFHPIPSVLASRLW